MTILDNLDPANPGNQDPFVDPPQDPPVNPPVDPAADPQDPPADSKWFDNFSDDTRNDVGLKRFKSAEEMFKSYRELETKIGAKGLIKPADDATDEKMEEYYRELGKPESSDKYELAMPEAFKDLPVDENAMGNIKDLLYKSNLSQDQAGKVFEGYMEMERVAAEKKVQADTESRQNSETELRKDWGEKFPENVSLAQKVAKQFGSEEGMKFLEEHKGGNDPRLLKMLANIGKSLSEDTFGEKGNSSLGMTPSEAQAKINEINNNMDHPYWKAGDSLHKEAVTEMGRLFDMVHVNKKNNKPISGDF